MKTPIRILLAAAALAAVACGPRERTLVLLSTNDMHGQIQRFPQLAAAVAQCRDTADVVLLDAGDRWTGNAYVDMAPAPGMPVIRLMNRLGYDAATLGNHEFDRGQAYLGRILDSVCFPVVCANVVSDTCTFPQLPASVVLDRGGVRVGIVGAITNYEGPGHPAGNAASFVGVRFPDPQQTALAEAQRLRGEVDLLVLLSHIGDDRDCELLSDGTPFDVAVGGHTHVVRDTVVGGTLLTQTGKNLRSVGVVTLRLRGGEVCSSDFRLVPLDGYDPDPSFAAEVARCYADSALNAPVGRFVRTAGKRALAHWIADAMTVDAGADAGFYHIGGVRLDSIPSGGVGRARIYDLEPFGTRVATMRMTPAQMRRMIVEKYNEPTREGRRLDLIGTMPYTIVVDADDRALDVRFPMLREGRTYSVAVSDYVFKNYRGLEYADGSIGPRRITEILLAELAKGAVETDDAPRQRVERR